MTEPKDEALREFESAANKTAIERQHAMEDAQRTCLKLRIEIEQLTKERDAERLRAEKAEARCKLLEALNLDNCQDDASIRKLVRGKLTDFEINGDSYGVPSPVDIVESLCRKFKE